MLTADRAIDEPVCQMAITVSTSTTLGWTNRVKIVRITEAGTRRLQIENGSHGETDSALSTYGEAIHGFV